MARARLGLVSAFFLGSSLLLSLLLTTAAAGTLTRLTDHPARDWDPYWSPDGTQLVFTSDREGGINQLFIMPAEVGAIAEPLTSGPYYHHHPCWSPDGHTIAYETMESGNQDVWRMPAIGGQQDQVTTNPWRDESLGWSHGGARITFDSNRASGNWDIWTIPYLGGQADRVTVHGADDVGPDGSHDGQLIAFSSVRTGDFELYTIPSGGGTAARLTFAAGFDFGPSWSPDDEEIVFMSDRTGNWDLWVIPAGGGDAVQLTFDPSADLYPNWSPDGTKIAFASERSGNSEIWVLELAPTSVVSLAAPMQFALHQNAPNPWGTSTAIRFEVPAGGARVSLRIYDVQGRLVRRLIDADRPAGKHALTWRGIDDQGRQVPGGIYFYQLRTPGFSRTLKMLLED